MEQSQPKRPFGLVIILLLQVFLIVFLSADSINRQTGFLQFLFLGSGIPFLGIQIEIVSTIYVVLTTYGIWRLKNWGWMLLMIQLGASMAFNLWSYFNTEVFAVAPVQIAIMLRDVILVFYLNHREVRGLFEQTGFSGKD